MASRKVKPVLVVDGEVTVLEVRVRVEAKAEAEAKKGLEGHVAWLGLVAREVAGMSWENENDSDTVQLVADGRGWLTFAVLLLQRRRGQPMMTTLREWSRSERTDSMLCAFPSTISQPQYRPQ